MNRTKVLAAVGMLLVAVVSACGQKKSSTPEYTSVATNYGQRPVSFRSDVYPILHENCALCHTPGAPGYAQSGFSVQSYQSVMKGTRHGPVIVPGSADSSTLVWVLKQGADPSVNMPKEYGVAVAGHKYQVIPSQKARRLSKNDVELIENWVDHGAKNN